MYERRWPVLDTRWLWFPKQSCSLLLGEWHQIIGSSVCDQPLATKWLENSVKVDPVTNSAKGEIDQGWGILNWHILELTDVICTDIRIKSSWIISLNEWGGGLYFSLRPKLQIIFLGLCDSNRGNYTWGKVCILFQTSFTHLHNTTMEIFFNNFVQDLSNHVTLSFCDIYITIDIV